MPAELRSRRFFSRQNWRVPILPLGVSFLRVNETSFPPEALRAPWERYEAKPESLSAFLARGAGAVGLYER